MSAHWLAISANDEIQRITLAIRTQVLELLRKRGAVIAVSGGIDSSVCAALAVRALGPSSVKLLALPDRHSSEDSISLSQLLSESLAISLTIEDTGEILTASNCYSRQQEILSVLYPDFEETWKFKIVLPSLLEGERLPLPRIVVQRPDGSQESRRISGDDYLGLVAATSLKQRTRTMISYYYADSLNYAVCGTPNRLEYDQGFFVKGGDGLADFKPIAHLYKSQVYALAEVLGIPEPIRKRVPTTDTFPMEQTQEEFYFSVPYPVMDLCLYGVTNNLPVSQVAAEAGLTEEQVARVYRDIESKRRATLSLHFPPLKVEAVEPVDGRVRGVIE